MTLFLNFLGSFLAGVAKLYAAYVQGKKDAQKEHQIEQLKSDLEAAKRLQNAKINTDVDAALKRLHERGRVRD